MKQLNLEAKNKNEIININNSQKLNQHINKYKPILPNKTNLKETKINSSKEELLGKKKKFRRGKFDSKLPIFQCPDCQKHYLSSWALKNHRILKHDYGKGEQKKGRGRPKKELFENDYINTMKNKYDQFLSSQKIKKDNNDIINISFIKNIFMELYLEYKNELFNQINEIKNNNFYKLLIDNWEKDNNNLQNKSYFSMMDCPKSESIVNKPSIDEVFFLYIKYLSNKINEDYLSFVIKFVIIFREFINREKRESINEKLLTDNKREYTQLYDSEIIPDLFNGFLSDFMQINNYFNLDKKEIIQLIEYFCFWLKSEGYTNSYISKIE